MSKIAVMFPGQGSQYQGMGDPFFEDNPEYKKYMNKCSEAIGEDILEIISDNPDKLNKTEYSQPAIYSLSCALFDYFDQQISLSALAEAVIGHSLGDFSALYACRAYNFECGLDMVMYRSRIMAEANKNSEGMMAAVLEAEADYIQRMIDNLNLETYIANYNHHAQTVISGRREEVRKFIDALKESGIRKIIPLKVGISSHCPLLKDVSLDFGAYMDKNLGIAELQSPFYSSTASTFIDETEIKANLRNQLVQPVRWQESIEELINWGFDTFIEIGPKDITGKLVKTIAGNNGKQIKIFSSENSEPLINEFKGGI